MALICLVSLMFFKDDAAPLGSRGEDLVALLRKFLALSSVLESALEAFTPSA